MPVGFVLLVLLIVDSAHFFTDDACHLMHEVGVPSCCQANRLRKEGGLLCIVPWHPHAMQAFCKCRMLKGQKDRLRSTVYLYLGSFAK